MVWRDAVERAGRFLGRSQRLLSRIRNGKRFHLRVRQIWARISFDLIWPSFLRTFFTRSNRIKNIYLMTLNSLDHRTIKSSRYYRQSSSFFKWDLEVWRVPQKIRSHYSLTNELTMNHAASSSPRTVKQSLSSFNWAMSALFILQNYWIVFKKSFQTLFWVAQFRGPRSLLSTKKTSNLERLLIIDYRWLNGIALVN